MKKNRVYTALLGIAFSTNLLVGSSVIAQLKGDEDKVMYNNVKVGSKNPRDGKAIDEAVNGWWTSSMKNHEQRIQWWRDAKFGMFIHWGIYSLPGGEWKGKRVMGYAEHLMRTQKISRADYLDIAHQFNPVKFNADEWVKAAKAAGMNYMIITAKHHDGFAMFDTKVSDFNVMQQTAWKHDPMLDLSAACKKYGVHFGFYYSHAFDWEHPDAPGNDWEHKNPGGDKNLSGGRDWFDGNPELLRRAIKYVDEKSIPQIKELLTIYHPDILWFDTPHKLPLFENIRILKAIREVDTNVVVNGRLAHTADFNFGDYKNTGDRPAEFYPANGDWEAIPTTNESYGYSKFDDSHKSVKSFVQLLAKAASRGGNLLLNVGPMGDGAMDERDLVILRGLGKWIDKNKESVYTTAKTGLPLQSFGVTTAKDNKLYLHVFNWPNDGKLLLGGLESNISKAYFLTDQTKKGLKFERANKEDISITVPSKMPDTLNTVIVLETKAPIKADSTRLLVNNMTNKLLAFDATLIGKGFKYADGKKNTYYVEGWKSTEQSVKWNVRVDKPTSFKVMMKYAATIETGGNYQIVFGGKAIDGNIVGFAAKDSIMSTEVVTVNLPKGTFPIEVKAKNITQKELMKLYELELIPL